MFNTPPIRPNGPQVIDPRAAYEQQSVLADQMLQRSQQYTGGGGLEALAMMLNAYGARKMGDQAQGSLSAALQQENERARAALLAEQEAEAAKSEADYQRAVRLAEEQARIARENQADPDIIRQMRAAGIEPSSEEGRRRILDGTGPSTVFMGPGNGPFREREGDLIFEEGPDGQVTARVIPGTDTYRQRQAAEGAEGAQDAARVQGEAIRAVDFGNISAKLDEVEGQISPWNTGLGSALSFVPGTSARDMAADIETLQSDAVMSEMQKLRDESYNGSTGLGQITEREIALLGSSVASFDPGQSPEEFRKQIQSYRTSYNALGQIKSINAQLAANQIDIPTAERMAAEVAQRAERERRSLMNEPVTDGQQPAQGGSQLSSQTEEILRGLGI